MWFTKNFRSLWWFVVLAALSTFLLHRYPSISGGEAKPFDFLLFIVWIGVCLGPLFAEIKLPGVTLKQKIEEVQREVSRDIESLRSDIRNSVDIRSQVSPHFWFGNGVQPLPDNRLTDLEQRLHAAINRLEQQGYTVDVDGRAAPAGIMSEREQIMFTSRRDIEVELRALASAADFDFEPDRVIPVAKLLDFVVSRGLVERGMARAILEVYKVCSVAIHGLPVSERKIDFVQKNGPELVSALRAIRSGIS
jgi:hypothetical protein